MTYICQDLQLHPNSSLIDPLLSIIVNQQRPALSRDHSEQAIPGKVQARVQDLAIDRNFHIEALYSLDDDCTGDTNPLNRLPIAVQERELVTRSIQYNPGVS